ncbi:prolyl oligopeptidase family serine peptidase [Mycobacteroides salmoniphilum]|uniref:prolyl oligopeptidase family serine peptidase n=1 Tax=Mycobacteroides salmoniphilum TaxID=404941 RepID=UPI001F242E54|nr:prolyl oligopeptidase family serine peptidase [Mycobacteroides salmoniphilum]
MNTRNNQRGPLLLMSGKLDHTVPDVLTRSTFKQYRKSSADTEYLSYTDRGHSLIVDSGAAQLIDDSLAWLDRKDIA